PLALALRLGHRLRDHGRGQLVTLAHLRDQRLEPRPKLGGLRVVARGGGLPPRPPALHPRPPPPQPPRPPRPLPPPPRRPRLCPPIPRRARPRRGPKRRDPHDESPSLRLARPDNLIRLRPHPINIRPSRRQLINQPISPSSRQHRSRPRPLRLRTRSRD